MKEKIDIQNRESFEKYIYVFFLDLFCFGGFCIIFLCNKRVLGKSDKGQKHDFLLPQFNIKQHLCTLRPIILAQPSHIIQNG